MAKRLGWVFIFIALLFFLFGALHILPFVAFVNIPIIAAFVILGIIVLLFGSDTAYELDKLEEHESEPDYYLKKFAPLWKRYMVHFKVSIAVLVIALLSFFLIPELHEVGIIWMLVFTFGPFVYLLALPFIVNLRCPKCRQYIFPWSGGPIWLWPRRKFRPLQFELYGQCPNCDVELKKGLII